MPKLDVVYALVNTVVTREGGVGVTIRQGEHWPASDPVVKDYPALFTDDPMAVGLRVSAPLQEPGAVEQATAAPGEKRTTRRPQSGKGE